jgi:hypothetical protein
MFTGAILFLQRQVAGSVHVVRLQIKLGQSTINKACAEKITNRLKAGDAQVREVLCAIPEPLIPVIEHCLVTTRVLQPEASDYFAAQDVRVLGREAMHSVWLEPIKEFDRAIGLGVYAPLE